LKRTNASSAWVKVKTILFKADELINSLVDQGGTTGREGGEGKGCQEIPKRAGRGKKVEGENSLGNLSAFKRVCARKRKVLKPIKKKKYRPKKKLEDSRLKIAEGKERKGTVFL